MDDGTIRIDDSLAIPASELTFRAVRAGGPGGQHVNTSATKVELSWSIAESPSLGEDQRTYLLARLANRVDGRGVLRLVEGRRRSQLRNREAVTERFVALLARALTVPKKRHRTRPPRSAKEQRMREKKQRSETKRRRKPIQPEE
ncbi:MAG: alternative ribosome rescue aminoacyl-tRNA hydrolase ArfB [Longimicrobiales bacterium]